jgi:hypothetical protein
MDRNGNSQALKSTIANTNSHETQGNPYHVRKKYMAGSGMREFCGL